MKQIFDKTVDVKQLFVDEDHCLLLLRADKGSFITKIFLSFFHNLMCVVLPLLLGRDGKVCVFALSDFEESGNDQAKTKIDCKEHKLERAKGNKQTSLLHFTCLKRILVRVLHRNQYNVHDG